MSRVPRIHRDVCHLRVAPDCAGEGLRKLLFGSTTTRLIHRQPLVPHDVLRVDRLVIVNNQLPKRLPAFLPVPKDRVERSRPARLRDLIHGRPRVVPVVRDPQYTPAQKQGPQPVRGAGCGGVFLRVLVRLAAALGEVHPPPIQAPVRRRGVDAEIPVGDAPRTRRAGDVK